MAQGEEFVDRFGELVDLIVNPRRRIAKATLASYSKYLLLGAGAFCFPLTDAPQVIMPLCGLKPPVEHVLTSTSWNLTPKLPLYTQVSSLGASSSTGSDLSARVFLTCSVYGDLTTGV